MGYKPTKELENLPNYSLKQEPGNLAGLLLFKPIAV